MKNIYEITTKLIGKIEPQGETTIDQERLENLKIEIELVKELIDDIIWVARHKASHAHSMKIAGEEADKFITYLKDLIN